MKEARKIFAVLSGRYILLFAAEVAQVAEITMVEGHGGIEFLAYLKLGVGLSLKNIAVPLSSVKALVISFRRGRHTVKTNQVILELPGVKNRRQAAAFVGKKVIYVTEGGKKLKGTITAPHGNKGRVRARFERGVPGQIIGKKVEIVT